MLRVPQIDFGSFKYAARFDTIGDYRWAWTGPSRAIQHMASRVMAAGQVLPVTPPASNATWTLDFWGPALQCNDVPETKSHDIFTNIWNSYNIVVEAHPWPRYGFLSWVPWSLRESWPDQIHYSPADWNITPYDVAQYRPFLLDGPAYNFTNKFDYPPIVGLGRPDWHIPKQGPPSSLVSIGGPLSLLIAVLPGSQYFQIWDIDKAGSHVNKYVVYQLKDGDEVFCDYGTIGHVTDELNNCTSESANITIPKKHCRHGF